MYSSNSVEDVIEAIKTSTKKNLASKEVGLKFLFDATIINEKEYKKLLKLKPSNKSK